MWCGHSPETIDAMPASDFQLFSETLPMVIDLTTLGGTNG